MCPDTSSGVLGRPSSARAEKGERLVAAFLRLMNDQLTVLRNVER